MRARILPLLITLSVTIATGLHADSAVDAKAKADALFQEGRALANQEKWPEACARFEASQKVDWAPGTLLNLAVCHARVHKNALAYAELTESLSLAMKSKRADREEICRQELAALEPKIARITLTVALPPPGLLVSIDGYPVAPESFGVARVVDPGVHIIDATAPGRRTWEAKAAVTAGDKKSVDVPELPIEIEPAPAGKTANPSDDALSNSNEPRTPASVYVLAGTGIALVGATIFARIEAGAALDDRKSACLQQATPTCDDTGVSTVHRWETISIVTGTLGAVSLGSAAYLYLSRPKSESTTSSAFVRIAPTGTGVRLEGAF